MEENIIEKLPLLALRGIAVFPGMILNFDVEREMSIAALQAAIEHDQRIYLVTQREIAPDNPQDSDLFAVGTVCTIKQVLKVPGSTVSKVLVEGLYRARTVKILGKAPYISAELETISPLEEKKTGTKTQALIRKCFALFDEYAAATGAVSSETILAVIDSEDPGFVADFVAQNVYLKHTEKQLVLEELRPVRRIELVNKLLSRELGVLSMEQKLSDDTREEINRSQRDYYLREQMKVIQRELSGDFFEEGPEELVEYREKIEALGVSKEIEEKLFKELSRLSKQPFGSSESALLRGYLDICLELPWNMTTKDEVDIEKARRMLDEDHFGLSKVKERIIEFLAVRKLSGDVRGGVLCLVGPPGVGKTSIAMSIARAMGRHGSRISLGGVHDEAEIRGHRKTYVGAMPGRIISGIQQAKSMNPVMVLDEIDKLASDFRGDPASALLEALDREQNGTFRDNFLEIPMDLSDVIFITTANTTQTIPRALLDRMEVIELTSYTDEEKLQIAKNHLLPKQRKRHGLTAARLKLSDDALREIISDYTLESGVRVLERELASLCRRVARIIAEGERKSVSLRSGQVSKYLGPPKHRRDKLYAHDEIGLVRGLAWTSVGGEVLDVEVGVMEGSGKLELTGNLGDVMKESARAAISYIRTRCKILGIDEEFYKNKDIHIHFPEGAIPKDGPSAGITICIAAISALTETPVRRDLAMTGEISLRGRIMPIGGLKEKTMAALRAGIHTVIIPSENEKDLDEIDPAVRAALNFIVTDHVDKILDLALPRRSQKNLEAESELPTAHDTEPPKRSIIRQVRT